jgi:phosphatidylserine/phosphatidylglycerophosphate/cardiolipin synthase-like enzyme
VDVFAFELDQPDILKSFMALGNRLRIVLDDSPVHRSRQDEVENRLKKAGCAVFHAHFKRFSHSKIIIRKINGQPSEVLTGSTNFSINSLFAQHNHVLIIRDRQAASIYAEYFQEAIRADSKTSHKWIQIEQKRLPAMRVLMCPSRDLVPAVRHSLQRAKRSILYSLADNSKNLILDVFNEKSKRPQQLLMGGVIHSSSSQNVLWGKTQLVIRPNRERRQMTGTSTGATSGNGKFIVIDFDQPDAVVFAGSASFSEAGARYSGDNLLEIHDPSIATQFATEALHMIEHYRFLAIASRKKEELKLALNENWWHKYYSPGDVHFVERTILANAPWTREKSPHKRRVAIPGRLEGMGRPTAVKLAGESRRSTAGEKRRSMKARSRKK